LTRAPSMLQALLFFVYGGFPVLYLHADWPAVHVNPVQHALGLFLLYGGRNISGASMVTVTTIIADRHRAILGRDGYLAEHEHHDLPRGFRRRLAGGPRHPDQRQSAPGRVCAPCPCHNDPAGEHPLTKKAAVTKPGWRTHESFRNIRCKTESP